MAHLHNINTDIKFYIDPITRAVKNESGKGNLIQYDHYAVRYGFELPRFVEGHDMTLCDRIEIHYINFASATEKSEDLYLVDDMQVSPSSNYMAIFSWLLSANATKYAGSLNFLIRFVCLDGENVTYSWSTDIFKDIKVGDGMDNSDAAIELGTDILEAWRKEVLGGSEEAAKRAEDAATKAEAAAEKATERVEEAVQFATDKVETAINEAADRAEAAAEAAAAEAAAAANKVEAATSEAADRAEDAAVRAEEAADRAEAEGGVSAEFDNRLKILEKWMNSETYEEMTAKLYVDPSGSKEYGDSVTGAVLTWETSEDVSYVKLTLPDGTAVDKIIEADLTETPLSKLTSYTDKNTYIITASKTWTLNATRADGNKETKSPTAKISLQYRVYWGLGTQEDGFDSDFVKSLQKTTLTTSKGRTLTFNNGADNQYVYYVIPTALGTPAFQIGDFPIPGGFEDGVKITVDTGFTYIDEKVEDDPTTEKDERVKPITLDYNLYRSSNLLVYNEALKVYVT